MPHQASAKAKMTANATGSQRVRDSQGSLRVTDSLGASDADARTTENQLAAMALDPEIQRELRQIDAEFIVTEADGLAGLS